MDSRLEPDSLAFDGFALNLPTPRRLMIVSQFTILRFFEMFPKCLLSVRPVGRAETAPVNDYPADLRSFQNVLGYGAAGLAKAVIGVSPPYQIGSFFMYIIKRKE
jgi:hypothetical protein